MKIKLITGFRRDQEYSIDGEEAHKAYYLFLHPEARGVFGNGLAIKGDQIQEIVPDWQGTMGWNSTHNLDSDDWNEIRGKGIDIIVSKKLSEAKDVARLAKPQELELPLSQLAQKYIALPDSGWREGKTKQIGDILSSKKLFTDK